MCSCQIDGAPKTHHSLLSHLLAAQMWHSQEGPLNQPPKELLTHQHTPTHSFLLVILSECLSPIEIVK